MDGTQRERTDNIFNAFLLDRMRRLAACRWVHLGSARLKLPGRLSLFMSAVWLFTFLIAEATILLSPALGGIAANPQFPLDFLMAEVANFTINQFPDDFFRPLSDILDSRLGKDVSEDIRFPGIAFLPLIIYRGGELRGMSSGKVIALPMMLNHDAVRASDISGEQRPTSANLDPESWRSWPVIPAISEKSWEIAQYGIQKGNNPSAFSVIGDCQSFPDIFMAVYDMEWYQLPQEYSYLENARRYFKGSFSRFGVSVLDAATAASELSPGWADPRWCLGGESPLMCELRLYSPAFAMINLGTHWTVRDPIYLRQIIDILIGNGVMPVLTTKADNLEGDFSVNLEIARIAHEHDLPLVNFWAAVQPLPNAGLDPVRQGGAMYLTQAGLEQHRLVILMMLDQIRSLLR